jgi:hypothetical protein
MVGTDLARMQPPLSESLWPFQRKVAANCRPETAALAAAIRYRPSQFKMLLLGDKTHAIERSQRPLGCNELRVADHTIAALILPDPINFSCDVECCRPLTLSLVILDHSQASTLYPTKPLRHPMALRAEVVTLIDHTADGAIRALLSPCLGIQNCPHVQAVRARYPDARLKPSFIAISDGPVSTKGAATKSTLTEAE